MYQWTSGIYDEKTGGGSIMKQEKIGGSKRRAVNFVTMFGLVVIFAAYMFPFLMSHYYILLNL